MAENHSYLTIIFILLIIVGLFIFTINIPKIFPIQKNEVNITQTKEYAFGLKSNDSLINGVVDIYSYNVSEKVVGSAGKLKEITVDIFITSLKMENKSYTSKILEMNKTYCYKGRSSGFYTYKECKLFEINNVGEKVDINLNKSSNINVYSNETIGLGENSLIFNIFNNDSLEYRDIKVCLDWSSNIIYSRLESGIEEIKRIGYYQHCYNLNKSLDNDNRVIALKLFYKNTVLMNDDFIEIYVFDTDEGYSKYNDFLVSEMNKFDVGGGNIIYKLTKYSNY